MTNEEKAEKKRTLRQNRALHVYFEQLAIMLNDAGLDMRVLLKPEVDIPWEKATVKKWLWKPLMKSQLLKSSTTEMNTKDINKVFNTINRHIAKKGVHVPWPSIESIFQKMREDEDLKIEIK